LKNNQSECGYTKGSLVGHDDHISFTYSNTKFMIDYLDITSVTKLKLMNPEVAFSEDESIIINYKYNILL